MNKKFLRLACVAAVVLGGLFCSVQRVEARVYVDVNIGGGRHCHGGVVISGYDSCGCPRYVENIIVGRDCSGAPIWGRRWIPIRHVCRPVHYYGGHGRPCSPPAYHHRRHGHSRGRC